MQLDRLKDLKLHGISKITHKFIMFLTYPFRHIFKFLALTFVAAVFLAALPMMQGVPYTDIIDWYLLKYEVADSTTSQKQPDIKLSPAPVVQPQDKVVEVEAPKIVRRQSVEPAENSVGKRQAFKPAETSDQPRKKYKVLKINKENRPQVVQTQQPKSEVAQQPAQPAEQEKSYYRKVENLPLTYEDNPQEVSGKTFVFSGNELTVGDTYIILYGIATPVQNQDQAHQYLKDLADGKNLTCKIVAYTNYNIASGVCFLNGQSINQILVDAGLSQNIAL